MLEYILFTVIILDIFLNLWLIKLVYDMRS